MTVTLNRHAFEHAKELIDEGRFVFDERDAWSEHRPSAIEEREYTRLHGFAEYDKWYLEVNSEKPENTEGHYKFPYKDFKDVHRCGVLAAESRAGQFQHYDIENAAAHLHDGRPQGCIGLEAVARSFRRQIGARSPASGAMTKAPVQRFIAQKTRLSTTLTSKHVMSGK
jgi:hypothetical protein